MNWADKKRLLCQLSLKTPPCHKVEVPNHVLVGKFFFIIKIPLPATNFRFRMATQQGEHAARKEMRRRSEEEREACANRRPRLAPPAPQGLLEVKPDFFTGEQESGGE